MQHNQIRASIYNVALKSFQASQSLTPLNSHNQGILNSPTFSQTVSVLHAKNGFGVNSSPVVAQASSLNDFFYGVKVLSLIMSEINLIQGVMTVHETQ